MSVGENCTIGRSDCPGGEKYPLLKEAIGVRAEQSGGDIALLSFEKLVLHHFHSLFVKQEPHIVSVYSSLRASDHFKSKLTKRRIGCITSSTLNMYL